MKSRFAITTITVVGLLGLVLVAFLAGLSEGNANAQRISLPQAPAPEPLVAESPPAFASDSNRYGPAITTPAAPTYRDQSPRYIAQPGTLSVQSTQPIVVAIKDGPQLTGKPVDLNAFKISTIFGPATIPVGTIAGLRMADDPGQPATICLSNGDSLTGVLTNNAVGIKTAWGNATIQRDHIVSIVTTTEPVTWQQHEGRWSMSSPQPDRAEEGVDPVGRDDKGDGADQPPALRFGPPATGDSAQQVPGQIQE